MDTLETIELRRSVKHYDPDFVMPEEDEKKLLELAMLSPTAFNIQHWRFVVVKDKEQRQKIREVSWGQAQVTDASMFIIMCAHRDAWKNNPSQYWGNAPEEVQGFLVPAIGQYYEGREQVQRDECMRSCGIAAQTLMLAAKSMGYDSCPMDGFDFDAVGKLINLPQDHVITMFVAIGKGIKEPWSRPGQLSYDQVVVTDSF